MSADNYYLIRKHEGKFVACMGFVSDEGEPEVQPHHPRFDTIAEAVDYASNEYSEYGVQLHESARQVRHG